MVAANGVFLLSRESGSAAQELVGMGAEGGKGRCHDVLYLVGCYQIGKSGTGPR